MNLALLKAIRLKTQASAAQRDQLRLELTFKRCSARLQLSPRLAALS